MIMMNVMMLVMMLMTMMTVAINEVKRRMLIMSKMKA
jgi:hypothetical protein